MIDPKNDGRLESKWRRLGEEFSRNHEFPRFGAIVRPILTDEWVSRGRLPINLCQSGNSIVRHVRVSEFGTRPWRAAIFRGGLTLVGLAVLVNGSAACAQDSLPPVSAPASLPPDLEPGFVPPFERSGNVLPILDDFTAQPNLESAGSDDPGTADRDDFIETDRNSFTISPRTVPRNQRILESTYTYIGVGSAGSKYSFPEAILRLGLTDRLEARIGYNFETGDAIQASEGDIVNGFGIDASQQAFYGFKYQVTRLSEKYRLLPESVIIVQGHTPIASISGHSQIRLGSAWGWELPNGWHLSQSFRFGTDRDHGDNYTLWTPSTVLKIPITSSRRWFTQLEYYSVMSDGKDVDFSMQFVDTGLHYLPTPNFEIGAMIGFGINDQTRGVILNIGFGYRF